MSAIGKYIDRIAVQTAVYWGNPRNDGQGGFIYDDPVEIMCRWIDEQQIITTSPNFDALALISRATVYTNEDLDAEGCLYLGTLDDLINYQDSSAGTAIPKDVPNTYIVKRPVKIPMSKSLTDYLKVYYLTPYIG